MYVCVCVYVCVSVHVYVHVCNYMYVCIVFAGSLRSPSPFSPPFALCLSRCTGRELTLFYCLNFGDHPDDVEERDVISAMIRLPGFDAVNSTLPKAAYIDLFLDGNLAVG